MTERPTSPDCSMSSSSSLTPESSAAAPRGRARRRSRRRTRSGATVPPPARCGPRRTAAAANDSRTALAPRAAPCPPATVGTAGRPAPPWPVQRLPQVKAVGPVRPGGRAGRPVGGRTGGASPPGVVLQGLRGHRAEAGPGPRRGRRGAPTRRATARAAGLMAGAGITPGSRRAAAVRLDRTGRLVGWIALRASGVRGRRRDLRAAPIPSRGDRWLLGDLLDVDAVDLRPRRRARR